MNNEAGQLEECWRRALWVLQALPPGHSRSRTGASDLRDKKLIASLKILLRASAQAGVSLQTPVVPGAPFLLALLGWAERSGVQDEALNYWHHLKDAASGRLEGTAGSASAAHAMMTAFAAARVRQPDTAFSEREIRDATVRELLAGK